MKEKVKSDSELRETNSIDENDNKTVQPEDESVAESLSIEGVGVELGGMKILENVTKRIDEARFVGVIGPNGAGKTTLVRTMNAVLEPDEGDVLLDDESVHKMSSKEASRRISTVPQNTNLSFNFDVEEIVEMGRNPHISRFGTESEDDAEAVEEAMKRTETLRFSDRSINEVSGGERQRVLLARALAQETPVVLLDEPTASLDINHQVKTLELVRELVDERGKTVVAAIHDLNLAAHYCDELVLVSDGEILKSGTPKEVLTEENLKEAFGTRAVISRHPVTGSVYVTAVPDHTKSQETESMEKVHVVAGGGNASRLLYLLSAGGYEVSVGALNEGDSDLETARHLGLETIEEKPFSEVTEETRREVENRIEESDATVVADIEVGTGNLPNLKATLDARNILVVEERGFVERNYAGDKAEKVYRKLKGRGKVVTEKEVLDVLEDLI